MVRVLVLVSHPSFQPKTLYFKLNGRITWETPAGILFNSNNLIVVLIEIWSTVLLWKGSQGELWKIKSFFLAPWREYQWERFFNRYGCSFYTRFFAIFICRAVLHPKSVIGIPGRWHFRFQFHKISTAFRCWFTAIWLFRSTIYGWMDESKMLSSRELLKLLKLNCQIFKARLPVNSTVSELASLHSDLYAYLHVLTLSQSKIKGFCLNY